MPEQLLEVQHVSAAQDRQVNRLTGLGEEFRHEGHRPLAYSVRTRETRLVAEFEEPVRQAVLVVDPLQLTALDENVQQAVRGGLGQFGQLGQLGDAENRPGADEGI
ncbi:MAG: hypothetical protein M3O28_04325 [Actinomycetota bacterium]|nr:hypothetical protein [Actinomycetota bacterium]